ncbi:unnamed protein product [Phytophthora lilii]|uniref:Unnamed protein product n=1 Tax=Phytophthora lilii TaxID=2077276 RepID=A0A9W6U565_9STRA|nr:unnamed protein product [Phytophthora lilii]
MGVHAGRLLYQALFARVPAVCVGGHYAVAHAVRGQETISKPEDFNLFQTLTFHPEHRHFLMWTLPFGDLVLFHPACVCSGGAQAGPVLVDVLRPALRVGDPRGLVHDSYQLLPSTADCAPADVCSGLYGCCYLREAAGVDQGHELHVPQAAHRRASSRRDRLDRGVPERGLPWTIFQLVEHAAPAPTGYIIPFTSVKLSLLIVIEMIQPSTVSLIFEWIVLRYMGKISFSVYLLHVFVIYTPPIENQNNYYDKLISVFALVTLLATVSYYLVEHPCQLLAQRLSRKFAQLAAYSHEKVPCKKRQ